MATALLSGSDDAALGATLTDLLGELHVRLVRETDAVRADLGLVVDVVLLLVPGVAHIAAGVRELRGRLRTPTPVVVVLPFREPGDLDQAQREGAIACCGLDQPIAWLCAAVAPHVAAR
jgi:hypothetical protein